MSHFGKVTFTGDCPQSPVQGSALILPLSHRYPLCLSVISGYVHWRKGGERPEGGCQAAAQSPFLIDVSESGRLGGFAHLPSTEDDVSLLSLPSSLRRKVSSVRGRKRRSGRR